MKKLLTLLIFFQLAHGYCAAQCGRPSSVTALYSNDMRVFISNSGDMFRDGNNYGEFRFAAEGLPGTTTILAQGLWVAGIDPGGNLRGAAQDYIMGQTRSDFAAGPVNTEQSFDASYCQNWNRIWSVARHEVEAHIIDFDDNQQIDNPISSLMEWPGKGNPFFEARLGFPLPVISHDLAPFYDRNNDGIYNPLEGDYPQIPNLSIIPEQISWTVFNDIHRNISQSQFPSAGLEIHLCAWALDCTDNTMLNRTIFMKYSFINRGNERLDSTYMGLWHNFEVGCFSDDYVGSSPQYQAFFAYNSDPVDETHCIAGESFFGAYPPAQAVSILNRPLHAFVYTSSPSMDPANPTAFYNVLTGRHADGTPITAAGSGYNTAGPVTRYAYHGDPRDADEWTMYDVQWGLPYRLARSIGSVDLGTLNPGEQTAVELAYLFVREPGLGHLENVGAMYEQLEILREQYANGFSDNCAQAILSSETEQQPPQAFAVFPNPAGDRLHFRFEGQRISSLELTTLSGHTALSFKGPFWDAMDVDVSTLPAGMYFVKMEQNGAVIVKKLIKH